MTALYAFLASLLEPLIEKLASVLAQKLSEIQKANESKAIDQAEKDMNAAESSDEIKKAADEARKSLGNS